MKVIVRGARVVPPYRYWLTRRWEPGVDTGEVCWIMLNPSTADAEIDDPTIRRCMGFSDAWGYDRLTVVNLYALRATNPRVVRDAVNDDWWTAVGPENPQHIEEAVQRADFVVAAWGSHAGIDRDLEVRNHVRLFKPLHCLGTTKDGYPKHPLYVRGDTPTEVLA